MDKDPARYLYGHPFRTVAAGRNFRGHRLIAYGGHVDCRGATVHISRMGPCGPIRGNRKRPLL